MAEIVNLKRARKRAARTHEAAKAKESRALHGQTAAEKENQRRAKEARETLLNNVRRQPEPNDTPV